MSEDDSASSGPIPPPPAAPPPEPPRPAPASAPSRAWAGVLLAVVVLALAWLAWQTWNGARAEQRAAEAERAELASRVEALARSAEQARRDADGLRTRLDDAAKVNESLRAQLLSLGERARLVEDAVANLADKRVSGHDALLLNEAEMLLALGAERFTLFHDAGATLDAYRLADAALSAIDDAAFSTVRQSISAESDALAALAAADTTAAVGQLQGLRSAAAQLPAPRRELPDANPSASRWAQLLGQFIRVRHGDDVAAAARRHDIVLARQLLVLDLRDAQAALQARDEARFRAALGDARALLDADFDGAAAATVAARAQIAALLKLAVAPAAPANLGAALRELRNLRATHALPRPAAAAIAQPAEPQP